MEAFRGPSRCVPTQMFLSECQQQDCYTNCGNASKKSTLSDEFEVYNFTLNIYIQKCYNIEQLKSRLGVVPFVCTFRKCNRRNKNVFENIKINYNDIFRNYCP